MWWRKYILKMLVNFYKLSVFTVTNVRSSNLVFQQSCLLFSGRCTKQLAGHSPTQFCYGWAINTEESKLLSDYFKYLSYIPKSGDRLFLLFLSSFSFFLTSHITFISWEYVKEIFCIFMQALLLVHLRKLNGKMTIL